MAPETKKKAAVRHKKSGSFWSAITNNIKGTTAFITAITGLLIALSQFRGTLQQSGQPERLAEEAFSESAQLSKSIELSATIVDPDGYTNIREGKGTNFKIIGRVLSDEVFYTIPQNGAWWPIRTEDNIYGYIRSNRIKLQE